MAHFHDLPHGQRLSNFILTVNRRSRLVGLYGFRERQEIQLTIRSSNPRVMFVRGSVIRDSLVLTVYVASVPARGAGKISAEISAIASDGSVWDCFTIEFMPQWSEEAAVGPITQVINDSLRQDANHCRQLLIPRIYVVDVGTFRAGDRRNAPSFRNESSKYARLGIFAARIGNITRAFILLLPDQQTPNRVLIGITHKFGQDNNDHYQGLGWDNPLSIPLIEDVVERLVRVCWGSQMLAATNKHMAMILPVRSSGSDSRHRNNYCRNDDDGQLGPFKCNGALLKHVIDSISTITHRAFTFDTAEFFTYSNGISSLNTMLSAVDRDFPRHFPITAIYNIDPKPTHSATRIRNAVLKQFQSGTAGSTSPVPGFEFMPLARWRNDRRKDLMYPGPPMWMQSPPALTGIGDYPDRFQYLHNHTFRDYCLYLGIQTS